MCLCVDSLYQVYGILQMVELYGVVMVVDEMEMLFIVFFEDYVFQCEEVYVLLMCGLMQLFDYFECLFSGYCDVLVVLLLLFNELCVSCKMVVLMEVVLFNLCFDVLLLLQVLLVVSEIEVFVCCGCVVDLWLCFQQQLLVWFCGQNVDQQLLGMCDIFNVIIGCCYSIFGC